MIRRILAAVAVSIIISTGNLWLPGVYTLLSGPGFKRLGSIESYERPCSTVRLSSERCARAFVFQAAEIDKAVQSLGSGTTIVGLGVGVLTADPSFYCLNQGGSTSAREPVFLFGSEPTSSGAGHLLRTQQVYQVHYFSQQQCGGDIVVALTQSNLSPHRYLGLKFGESVIGDPHVIGSFKAGSDILNSFTRLMLGISAFVLGLIVIGKGTGWVHSRLFTSAVIAWAIHLSATSYLLEFVLPVSIDLSAFLSMIFGIMGSALVLISIWAPKLEKKQELNSATRATIKNQIFLLLMLVTPALLTFGASFYAPSLLVLGVVGLFSSLACRRFGLTVFYIFHIVDVCAAIGEFRGFPSNIGAHYLLLAFIISFYSSHNLLVRDQLPAKRIASIGDVYSQIRTICDMFKMNRGSVSILVGNSALRSYIWESSGQSRVHENEGVSRIVAGVVMSRTARLRTPSTRSRRDSALQDQGEYSIFPLFFGNKAIGTLNFSSGISWRLQDPLEMDRFLELVQSGLPKISEYLYSSLTSDSIEMERQLVDLESHFVSSGDQTLGRLTETIGRVAALSSCRVIILMAVPSDGRFKTVSVINYAKEDAAELSHHSPRLNPELLESPINISYFSHQPVVVDDLAKIASVYAPSIVALFSRNATKQLVTIPIGEHSDGGPPWGVAWIEFGPEQSGTTSLHEQKLSSVPALIQRLFSGYLNYSNNSILGQKLESLAPARVLERLRKGETGREEEIGFILNIDLAGSTRLATKCGELAFTHYINKVRSIIEPEFKKLNFMLQQIIWDAFVLTKSCKFGPLCPADVTAITAVLDRAIAMANADIDAGQHCSYRAVLHYGDVSRDFVDNGLHLSWEIVGAAFAESCKMESSLKGQTQIVWVSSKAQEKITPMPFAEVTNDMQAA